MCPRLIHVLLCVALCAGVVQGQNQILNWEFDEPTDPTTIWGWWRGEHFDSLTIVEGAGLSGPYAMKVDIGTGPLDPLQIIHHRLELKQDATYTISFMAKADAPRTVTVQLQSRDGSSPSWWVYWQEADLQLTTEPQTFTFEYTHTDATVGGTGDWLQDIDLHFILVGDGTDLYLDRIWMGEGAPPATSPEELAKPYDPVPDDGATDVPRDAVLSWTAGPFAVAHDVYFGETFEDVNQANRDNPLEALKSQGQAGTQYDPDGLLDFDQTYYWRIDEVNAPPDSTVFAGDVWSFTTESYGYPIANVTATASSAGAGTGPEKTVDGSGLNASDEHSTTLTDMWLTAPGALLPAWIQFAFDQPYELEEMLVWNSNQLIESWVNFGAKDVTVEYSLDGADWTMLGDVEFVQAPGDPAYTYDTAVDLSGVNAQYVRLTINSNWAGVAVAPVGLSEVRFTYVPAHARQPDPANGAEDVSVDAVVSWREGRRATAHEVYFDTDADAVDSRTVAPVTVSERRYTPDGLQYGQLYFWGVDEVNDTTDALWAGPTWYFATAEYFVVDNFESYTNDVGSRPFQTWIDGWGYTEPAPGHPGNHTGATVGHDIWTPGGPHYQGDLMEKSIVRSGNQSMPVYYDNTASPYRSEAQRLWASPQNWTAHGADTVTLHFHGDMANELNPLYLAIEDAAGGSAVKQHPDPNAVRATGWTEWSVSWDELPGVDMTRVTMLAVGVGSRTSSQNRGTGVIYLDDVWVGSPREPVGLVAHYALENDATDSSGNEHHGTLVGDPTFVNGPAGFGMGLEFDGTGGQYVDLGTFNPSVMTGRLSVSLWVKWNGLSDQWQGLIGKRIGPWQADQMMWQIEADRDTGDLKFQRAGNDVNTGQMLPADQWAHIAVTFDGTTARIYLDGVMIQEGSFSFGSDPTAPIQFGASTGGGGNPFNGALDEVRLYDVALSQQEIRDLAGL